MRIWYLPLEPLEQRYSMQLSSPGGWFESGLRAERIPFMRIEGKPIHGVSSAGAATSSIKKGGVLDACGRGYWACSQVMAMLRNIDTGLVRDEGDVLFVDDFWHPGLAAIRYACDLYGLTLPIYSYCYAQSVDEFDFTYKMLPWIRPFEHGIAGLMDGIFVACSVHKELCIRQGVGTEDTVHVTGHIWNTDEVLSRLPFATAEKKRQVIWASRWDTEKCPEVFLRIVRAVKRADPSVNFLVTTSAPRMTSNSPRLASVLRAAVADGLIELREGITKEEYYQCLAESTVHLNTADQDFISYALLESTTFGCAPVFPYFRSFPEVLRYDSRYLYPKGYADEAAKLILSHLDTAHPVSVDWIPRRFDRSVSRMVNIMLGETWSGPYDGPLARADYGIEE